MSGSLLFMPGGIKSYANNSENAIHDPGLAESKSTDLDLFILFAFLT
jgi:hypothetical protein